MLLAPHACLVAPSSSSLIMHGTLNCEKGADGDGGGLAAHCQKKWPGSRKGWTGGQGPDHHCLSLEEEHISYIPGVHVCTYIQAGSRGGYRVMAVMVASRMSRAVRAADLVSAMCH